MCLMELPIPTSLIDQSLCPSRPSPLRGPAPPLHKKQGGQTVGVPAAPAENGRGGGRFGRGGGFSPPLPKTGGEEGLRFRMRALCRNI